MDKILKQEEIQSHIERGNYHAGINLAISAMNECRRNDDQQGVDRFLEVIRQVTLKMSKEFGSKAYQEQIK